MKTIFSFLHRILLIANGNFLQLRNLAKCAHLAIIYTNVAELDRAYGQKLHTRLLSNETELCENTLQL